MERTIQYIKDRTEGFDDYLPYILENSYQLTLVGSLASIIMAKLSIKKAGIKSSKISWFWLIQVLLTVIATRFIMKAIDFIVSIGSNKWVPGQILEGITGLLAIIGAIVVGICLFLIYTGKIKTENGKEKQKQQPESLQRQHQLECLVKEKVDMDSSIRKAKEEVDIVSSSLGWIINKHTNSLKNVISKENSTINGVKILVQNPSLFNADVYDIHSELNNALVTKNQKEDYTKHIARLKQELQSKRTINLDIRMVEIPIMQSIVIIDPVSSDRYDGEMYIEPFHFQIRQDQQVVYRIRRNSKKNDVGKVNIFDVEYASFVNLWKVAVPYDGNQS